MNKKVFLIGLCFFNLIVIVSIIGNIIITNNTWKEFEKNSVTTRAEIISITGFAARGGERHSVYIRYNDLQGNEHNGKLDYYKKDMTEGSFVRIYYNKSNPDDFMTDPDEKNSNYGSWFVLLLFIDAMLIVTIKIKRG